MLCVSLDIPVAVENPHSSRLWHAPPMEHLRSRNVIREFVTDFGQWGQPWRKHTHDSSPMGSISHALLACARVGRASAVARGRRTFLSVALEPVCL
eukprot:14936040-Heterocapsa_arctica.AAC.2